MRVRFDCTNIETDIFTEASHHFPQVHAVDCDKRDELKRQNDGLDAAFTSKLQRPCIGDCDGRNVSAVAQCDVYRLDLRLRVF